MPARSGLRSVGANAALVTWESEFHGHLFRRSERVCFIFLSEFGAA